MAILGKLIMLKTKSHGHTVPHEVLVLISLKQAIYNKFVQLREFSDLTWNSCQEQDTQRR